MKHIFFLIQFCSIFLYACTQSKSIQKAYAFSQHITQGNIPVDNNGTPMSSGVQTNRYIYLESKSNITPKISEVVFKGQSFKNPEVYMGGRKAIQIGYKKNDGSVIIITPSAGNTLWRIELPANQNQNQNLSKSPSDRIIIKGYLNGKAFAATVTSETELRPIDGV